LPLRAKTPHHRGYLTGKKIPDREEGRGKKRVEGRGQRVEGRGKREEKGGG
jgi:hypothetical protein